MSHKYIKKSFKTDIDKVIEFHKIIDSVIIEDKDYREIFDNAIQFEYGKPLDEYSENRINSIMVNSIRHNNSNYDLLTRRMHRIRRNTGENDYVQYKNSVLNKIANMYPLLEDECNKQKRRFDMVNVVSEVG